MAKRVLTCDQDYRSELIDALTAFDSQVRATAADAWAAPSPCEGWTAADVVVHVTGNTRLFIGTVGDDVSTDTPQQPAEEDLVGGWEQARSVTDKFLRNCSDSRLEAVVVVGREMTVAFVMEAFLRDIVIHTWDLARATGADETLPAHLVTATFSALSSLPLKIRQRGYYADPLPTPPNATDQDRLLALSGRRA